MKITYFVNHYPKVSHSFIRREILALEQQGFTIQRIASRGYDGPLPDAEDQQERARTQYLMKGNALRVLLAMLLTALHAPTQFCSALALTLRTARHSDRSLAHHLMYFAEACALVPLMRRFGSEHLHAHFGTNSTDVAMLARILGGPPYSFTAHGPEEFSRQINLREKIHHSAFAVAISSFGRSQLCLSADHPDWIKIKVVHCGLEKKFYEGAQATPVTAARFICVGRLTEAKGQQLVLDAMAQLAARGIHCELVLAGDGPARPQIERLIEHYGLADRVRITGWISSRGVREEILAARALVLPSFAEGLPVVIMEAMALRRPVLSTYVAGIPELVQHGRNGWLFPAASVPDLAQAMEECLAASPAELARMGAAAHERVAARHAIESSNLAELLRSSERAPGALSPTVASMGSVRSARLTQPLGAQAVPTVTVQAP